MTTRALTRKGGNMLPSSFDDFFMPLNFWDNEFMAWTLTIPAVNIDENKDQFNLSLAIPGIKKEDFNIEVEGKTLNISCEKEEKKEEKQKNGYHNEFNYSSFSRSFTLPQEVIREKIDARYEDGILKLLLPKKEEAIELSMNHRVLVK